MNAPTISRRRNDRTGPHSSSRRTSLEDFERLVFVLSVLEHYSEHDCGLLALSIYLAFLWFYWR